MDDTVESRPDKSADMLGAIYQPDEAALISGRWTRWTENKICLNGNAGNEMNLRDG